MTYYDAIKVQCRKERQFQDKKFKELNFVHDVLDDESMTQEEKFVSLVAQGWGRQRAMQIVFGGRHDFR